MSEKENKYHLAVDIGASGGRHILGYLRDGRLVTREIFRFENGPVRRSGHLVWDVEKLYALKKLDPEILVKVMSMNATMKQTITDDDFRKPAGEFGVTLNPGIIS